MNAIVDNKLRNVGEFLLEKIKSRSQVSVVSAYFTIYAYEALRDVLDGIEGMRFLYGDPRSVNTVDPGTIDGRSFGLSEDGGMDLQQALAQKPLACACAKWIKEKVEIRTIQQTNFLHGKLYHILQDDSGSAALAGSSNFTRRGLGFGTMPNIELNLDIQNNEDQDSLLEWFDDLWNDSDRVRDVKQEVLAALKRLGAAYAPEFVYYKTLLHVFEDKLSDRGTHDRYMQDIRLDTTTIWKSLYEFQKHGATSAINRLQRYNGCIIADSVGLGKTWTALAVIKYFELHTQRVLVLCPKRLEDNWIRYVASASQRNNPFLGDGFDYTVLAHTDLSRDKGMSTSGVNLARINWSGFGLVVIDESHNFRNEGHDQVDDEGRVIKLSRYNKLLEEVIKDQIQTKVLMLSATPVNTTLRDLRNQIYLMTTKCREAFRDELGINDIQSVFGVAQRKFQEWARNRQAGQKLDKNDLIEGFGADFLRLLDAVTIARSRAHISRYYPDVVKKIGGFPDQAELRTEHPATDRNGELSYDDLHQQIGNFKLAVYNPSSYVKDSSALDAEKERSHFDHREREHWLIGMIRTTLLKRLESSVYSFTLSVQRMRDKMRELDQKIEQYKKNDRVEKFGIEPEENSTDDDEFIIGKGRQYHPDEIDLDRWQHDLQIDLKVFDDLYAHAQQVDVKRDAKFAKLLEILEQKTSNPTCDKDGIPNRKVVVFTSFSETAEYLYDNITDLPTWKKQGVDIALITGGGKNKSTTGAANFVDILMQFTPKAQQREGKGTEIEILIATDCLSEGQNLQDCDLVVNYDIHWNPVRLIQRLGRIDRIGSRNKQVAMINFWPTENLERYLDLKDRVEARMAMVDATATGHDNPLDMRPGGNIYKSIEGELRLRDNQLRKMFDEHLVQEETDDGLAMSELTLDEFFADLMHFTQKHMAELKASPTGIYAITTARSTAAENSRQLDQNGYASVLPSNFVRAGVIFCLKQKVLPPERTPNLLQPYFLVYIHNDGTIQYSVREARRCLSLFRDLAVGKPGVAHELERAFDNETEHGHRMKRYENLLKEVVQSITSTSREMQFEELLANRDAKLVKELESPSGFGNLELITWLIIMKHERPSSAAGSKNA